MAVKYLIFLTFAAVAHCGLVPAVAPLAVAPFASSYHAQTTNHAVSAPIIAPVEVARISALPVASAFAPYASQIAASPLVSSAYVAAPGVLPYAAPAVFTGRK